MVKRCPTCNRTNNEIRFVGEFCEKCASEKLIGKLPVVLEVDKCRVCGRIKTKEGMFGEDKTSLSSVIQQRLIKFRVKVIGYGPGRALVDVVAQTAHDTVSAEKEFELKYRKITCDSCYKRIGGYYEATLQLRGDLERISRFIERVSRYLEERDSFVAKVEKVDNGYDVFVSNKAAAAAFISEREIVAKTSYTLSGVNKSGKKVYKNTYAIRL